MFDNIRKMLDEYERIANKYDSLTKEEIDFIDDYEFNMAKTLYKELPQNNKIAKMICVMHDDYMIKLEVK